MEIIELYGNLSLLLADDVILLASVNGDLQLELEWLAVKTQATRMKISTSKSERFCLSASLAMPREELAEGGLGISASTGPPETKPQVSGSKLID